MANLSERVRRSIERLHEMGWSQIAIAKKLRVHRSTVARVTREGDPLMDDLPATEIERRFITAIRAKRPRPPLS